MDHTSRYFRKGDSMTRIIMKNRYQPTPQQKRRASRGYIKGTRMTKKKPGDLLICENGECFVIDNRGFAIAKEA